ncbi:MAG: hypothetical protein ACRD6W_19675, partial [Nitrososphaerales archaeon]
RRWRMPKHPLQSVLEGVGYECRSYSGRGMYGAKCLGVEIDRDTSLGYLVGDLIDALEGDDDLREVADGFRQLRSDDMGLGTIFYFPGVPYVEDEPEEEEDEEDGGPPVVYLEASKLLLEPSDFLGLPGPVVKTDD